MNSGTYTHLGASRHDFAVNDFDRLMNPRGIAIIGASEDIKRVGCQPMRYLTEYGYPGDIFPVNPKYSTIYGRRCYSSISELPKACDVALIAVAAKIVPESIERCAGIGIPYAIVLSAGFREIGEEGEILEAQLKSIIDRTGVRVVGPNCQGIMSVKSRVYNGHGAGFMHPNLKVGPIAMVTQSGGYGFALLTAAEQAGIGFSYVVSTGNSTDIDSLDFLEYFLKCSEVEIIAIYMEGVTDGRRMIDLGKRALEAGKPILVWKAGNSESGRRASASHTARLTASYELYRTAFRGGGFIEVRDYDDLIDIGRAFQARRLPAGGNIAVLTSSGGTGVLLADRCEEYGLVLPTLSGATLGQLQRILPANVASPQNPVDISGQRSKDNTSISNKALEIVLEDPGIDQIILRSKQSTATEHDARKFVEIYQNSDKPVLVAMGGDRDAEALSIFDSNKISWHGSPSRAARAAGALHEFAHKKRRQDGIGELNRIVQHKNLTLPEGAITLGEHAAKACLATYGIPVVREKLMGLDDIDALTETPLPFPLAVKINSADIPHKTEANAVRLGVSSIQQLKQAAHDVWIAAQSYKPNGRLEGVLVQEMASGTEVIVGAVNDSCFGPTVMFGLGGIFTEILKDVTYRFAPFGLEEAREMMTEIKAGAVLKGYRGNPRLDMEGLAQVLSRVSWLLADHADRIAEIDINPIFVTPTSVKAADGLIVLRDSGR